MMRVDTISPEYHIRRIKSMRVIRDSIHPAKCYKVNQIVYYWKVFEDKYSIPGTGSNVYDSKNTIRAITVEFFGDYGMEIITELSSNEEVKQCEPEKRQFLIFEKFVVWKSILATLVPKP